MVDCQSRLVELARNLSRAGLTEGCSSIEPRVGMRSSRSASIFARRKFLQTYRLIRENFRLWRIFFVVAAAISPGAAYAEVTRLLIDSRRPDTRAGSEGYEIIRGRLVGQINPHLPANAVIQDVTRADRVANGKVEYIATFTLLRPIKATAGKRVLVAAVPNRGGRGVASWLDRAAVDPIYYRMGYSVLWIGWQGDLPERPDHDKSAAGMLLESIAVPRAHGPMGAPLIGPVLLRVPTVAGPGPSGTTMMLSQGNAGALAYPPAELDSAAATLTGGAPENAAGHATSPRYTIPAADWRWWDCRGKRAPDTGTAPADLCIRRLRGTFDDAQAYTLVFPARDPLVLGIGMAALRDGVAFFRRAATDGAGTANPVAGQIDHVIGQGVSQVGNLVKTMIALGFNADEQGKRVWDGVQIHISGRRAPINHRFAMPGGSASLYMPGSEGVLWWGKAANTVRGGPPASLLDRCRASGTCPKIFETFGGAELWNQRMSAGLVTPDGRRDIPLPDEVRRYFFPGTQHGGGKGGFSLRSEASDCTMMANPNPETDQMRALTLSLVRWVVDGKEPPASAYPRRSRSELVRDVPDSYRFPDLAAAPRPYGLANPLLVYDFGPDFDYVDMSGIIVKEPPKIIAVVPSLIAQVDRDGNETSGVPSVQLSAPIGTYFSWNTFRDGPYAGRICSFNGGFLPFARTRSERLATKDPRLSIEERYRTRKGYVRAVARAAAGARARGFLLSEDAVRLIGEAKRETETGDLSFLARDPPGRLNLARKMQAR